MSTFILSLETQAIRAIAQMLHMRRLESPESSSIENALEDLRQQTNIVTKNPKHHGIYENPLTAPDYAVKFDGKFYLPVL